MIGRFGLAFVVGSLMACGSNGPAARSQQVHSSPITISPDGTRLFVVHPDADSVSILDAGAHKIVHEILLAKNRPAQDAITKRYEPAVGPRALALDSTGSTLYVTGQRSGRLYAVDTASATLKASVSLCSEPIGVVLSADDANAFVACAQDDEIVEVRTSDLGVVTKVACPRKPWALAWAADGQTLLATHLLGPGVSTFAISPLALRKTWQLADAPPRSNPSDPQGGEDPTEPHGQVRGIYDAMVRPGTSDLWVPHILLGTDTPQPTLNFLETVFPAISILDQGGAQLARLSVQANTGDGGAFGDVVSGPRALTFSDDGKLAFVVDADSEDVLVVDTERRVETQIIRPLPGHLPEGIVWSRGEIYVQERNSEDVVAFRVERSDAGVSLVADGAPFSTLSADPMPSELRLGQKLFFSSNSDDVPLTQNHWVACASCHIEGRSDAVTWRFAQGPRDTPTNAGGLLDTGFLFRTADRSQVQDYWKTIDVEQGGDFNVDEPSQKPLLNALAAYVNYAIPTPVPPSTDAEHTLTGAPLASLRAQGAAVFDRVGCATCHSGPAKTDSGSGNSSLDLTGPLVTTNTPGGVLLHDVGTCVTGGAWPDVAHDAIDGQPRTACAFDTPALRGLTDSAPYLHDGSAATLDDVIPIMLKASARNGAVSSLSSSDEHALLEYLRSL